MGRNNENNIKKYNDKLRKGQDKIKEAKKMRVEKLKQIIKNFNENNNSNKTSND